MTRAAYFPLITALTILTVSGAMLVAGPLDPPSGPIAPTHKTLTEVEPRTAINATNTPGDADSLFKITKPGSYYLTGNITGVASKHGIEIDADGVTLDLTGFTLQGVANSLDGVNIVPGRNSVTVRNGSLREWGESGLSAVGGPNARNCLYIDLTLDGNSTSGEFFALDMGGSNTAINCVASMNRGSGIRGNDGCVIIGCIASGNLGEGILCGAGTVRDCVARGNGFDGFVVGLSVVTGCTATANGSIGFAVNSHSHLSGNTSSFNLIGYYAYGNFSRLDSNHSADNEYGFYCDAADCTIVRNSSTSDGSPYDIVAGNDVGPIGSAETAMSPWANFKR
jgi:hypothetical protein